MWLYNWKTKKQNKNTHTPNSPDIHTWLTKTHSKLTRQACRATRGQPWTSCCPCSSVATDTWLGSRASCWGRTASGSHTAGMSLTGTGAAQGGWTRMAPSDREVNRTAQSDREVYRTAGSDRGGQQNSIIKEGGKQNSTIRQGGQQNSKIKEGGKQNSKIKEGGKQNSTIRQVLHREVKGTAQLWQGSQWNSFLGDKTGFFQ